MFFLKELPNREMIQRYEDQFDEFDSDAIESTLIMMKEASLLVRRLDAYFASFELSQLRFLILIVIDREYERDFLYAYEIAERLDVSRPVLTRALKSLETGTLIASQVDERDARAKVISLTKAGEKKLQSLLPGYFKEIGDFMNQAPATINSLDRA